MNRKEGSQNKLQVEKNPRRARVHTLEGGVSRVRATVISHDGDSVGQCLTAQTDAGV